MIDELIWQVLEGEYRNFPKTKCADASDEQIMKAEEELDVRFSDFFRYFLKFHSVNNVKDTPIFTIEDSDLPSDSSIVRKTKDFRKKFSRLFSNDDNWYVISENKNNEYLGINQSGEIWLFSNNFEKTKVANDFEEFLANLLK